MRHDVAAGKRSVWADPVVRWCGAAAACATVWFLVVLIAPAGPVLAGWLLTPLSVVLAAAVCRRVGTSVSAPAAASRFWRRVALALAVFSLSMVSRIVDSVNPDFSMTARLSLTSAAGHAAGLGLLMWALFMLPAGRRTRTQQAALWLDLGTVIVAAGVAVWHFTANTLIGEPHRDVATLAVSIGLIVAGLASVLVVAKTAITATASLPRPALRMLGAALTVGGLGSTLNGLLVGKTYVDTSLIVVPVAVLLIALGARYQVVTASLAATGRGRRRRFSVLPYLAVAATDALMLATVAENTPDRLVVTGAATGLTVLVVVRQLMAFRENDTLLGRLDTGLMQLRQTEQRFRSLVQNATDVFSISDKDGLVSYISPSVEHILGYEPERLLNTDLTFLVHPDDRDIVATSVVAIAATAGAAVTYEARLAHADGSWRWFEITSGNRFDEPSVAGIVSNSRDITETRKIQDRLTYEATHDVLTGLANRALFHDNLRSSLAHPDTGHRLGVVLVDLDDFKTVNDTLGHAVGDVLLTIVADKLQRTVRPQDTVARLGGDEFAILFDGIGDDAIDRVLARITAAFAEPVDIDGHRFSARASFGVVEGRAGDNPDTLLRQADIAMYEAKARGEGGYARFQSGMRARGAQRREISEALATALDNDQFVLHYQPVVDLSDHTFTGTEALLRWQHPTDGLLAPDTFIPAAEQTGLIVPIGRWVLHQATRQAAAWLSEYGDHAPATVAVNVSAQQLSDPRFVTDVQDALGDSGLLPHRLIIEITESTAVDACASIVLQQIRDLGVRVSLDDFGTGASTLSLLNSCAVDQIKLDRSFAPAGGSDAIAVAVAQLARAFGLGAVAEGVETSDQAALLTGLGYEHAQGYYFARPMTAATMTSALQSAASNPLTTHPTLTTSPASISQRISH
jgi:diguanylate cyclase (GGDEF)-like protein/PAS domain S-box-containing protein